MTKENMLYLYIFFILINHIFSNMFSFIILFQTHVIKES